MDPLCSQIVLYVGSRSALETPNPTKMLSRSDLGSQIGSTGRHQQLYDHFGSRFRCHGPNLSALWEHVAYMLVTNWIRLCVHHKCVKCTKTMICITLSGGQGPFGEPFCSNVCVHVSCGCVLGTGKAQTSPKQGSSGASPDNLHGGDPRRQFSY